MKAMYAGWCSICDRPWPAGEEIAKRKGEYVHADCVQGER